MQNAAFDQPVAMGFASSGCIQARETTLPGCRSVALPCNRMCTGLQLQERSSCVWRGVRAGQSLYQQGEPLHFFFVVRSGTFKSTLAMEDGSSRICAFPMTGDVIALDGLGTSTGGTTMTALDDAHVCAVSSMPSIQGTSLDADLQGHLRRLMSEEIVRNQKLLVLMGRSCAQDRMGAFLLDLSLQHRERGYSGRDFALRMTRSDIGSFLGMALETVSRSLSIIQAEGAIDIVGRRIRISDLEAFSKRYVAWQ